MILLASGTGFAPIKALLEHMQFKGIDAARVAVLGRPPQGRPVHGRLAARADGRRCRTCATCPVLSNATPDDNWTGRTGFVHQAVLEDFADLSGHQVYACGAPIVVDSAKRDYVALAGLPEEEFYADAFTTEADKALP
jgi:CDP-4-dehydro-6-deoxyglucose reductase